MDSSNLTAQYFSLLKNNLYSEFRGRNVSLEYALIRFMKTTVHPNKSLKLYSHPILQFAKKSLSKFNFSKLDFHVRKYNQFRLLRVSNPKMTLCQTLMSIL